MALNSAWATSMVSPARARSLVPAPTSTMRKPSWLTVPNASTSLRSVSRSARHPATSIDTSPSVSTVTRQGAESAKPGASRATRKVPAFTMAAACRYALTGVGAAMAPGSQKCMGTMADLLSAPTSTATTATPASHPRGALAMTSESR